jgi:hypothetical protein
MVSSKYIIFRSSSYEAQHYTCDRLCGLVVRVLGYRSGGPGLIPGTTKKKGMGLERGPLSFVSTTKELLERKSSGSCLENREYGRRDLSRWPRGTFYPHKLAITSPTSGGLSVGIVRSRTQTMEFFLFFITCRHWSVCHVVRLYDTDATITCSNSVPVALNIFLIFESLVGTHSRLFLIY